MLDRDFMAGRESLLPEIALFQSPVRRDVTLHAFAHVIFVDAHDLFRLELLLNVFRQRIEGRMRLFRTRHKWDVERLQTRCDVPAGDQRLLLDIRLHRHAVDTRAEVQEIVGLVVGHGDIVGVIPVDAGHGKGDEDSLVHARAIEEPIAHDDLLLGNRQILGAHLDVVRLAEHQPTGGQRRHRIVGARRRAREEKADAGERNSERAKLQQVWSFRLKLLQSKQDFRRRDKRRKVLPYAPRRASASSSSCACASTRSAAAATSSICACGKWSGGVARSEIRATIWSSSG